MLAPLRNPKIPNLDGFICTTADEELTIGAKGDRIDQIRVSCQPTNSLMIGGLPNLNIAIYMGAHPKPIVETK